MPNPYDFVPLRGKIQQKKPAMFHHILSGRCGSLTCTLEALAPLFTASGGGRGAERLNFAALPNGTLIIPASSLKGVIRNVAEAVSSSCVRLSGELFDNRGQTQSKYQGRIDTQWRPCREYNLLCPACRLFGMVGARTQLDEDAEVFAGQVQIGEAHELPGVRRAPKEVLITLMQPHPHHQSFYQKAGQVRGRKFYFHHPGPPVTDSVKSRFNKYILPVLPGSRFTFPVHYQNLDEDELSLLLYALVLEPTMAHKIGMGKPLGFGSARITIIQAEEVSPNERYIRLGGGKRVREGQELQEWIDGRCRSFRERKDEVMVAFRRILTFHPSAGAVSRYRYPGQSWFKQNPTVPLEGAP